MQIGAIAFPPVSPGAQGGATVVKVTEQYSDAMDVPTDRDTALTTKNGIARSLADLKAMAEKK